jgi:hypothetical protein
VSVPVEGRIQEKIRNMDIGFQMLSSYFKMNTLTKAVLLNLLILIPSAIGQNKTISTVERMSENSTHNDDIVSNPETTVGDMFRLASYEIVELSPLAWMMILIPLTATYVFCTLIVYLCCCRRVKPGSQQCRYEPKKLVDVKTKEVSPPRDSIPTHVVVKAPAGQPAPIPLTGLVNLPNGQGLRLMPKNHYYQPPMHYN